MESETPFDERTPQQRAVDERLRRVKEARELHARGVISEAEMGSMLLQVNLERILILHTRGIIREGEMTNSLIDSLLSTEPLGPEAIAVFLRTVPAKVQEALKAGLARGPRTEAEWDEMRVVRFGATEEGLKHARSLTRRNIESLRQHFGLNP